MRVSNKLFLCRGVFNRGERSHTTLFSALLLLAVLNLVSCNETVTEPPQQQITTPPSVAFDLGTAQFLSRLSDEAYKTSKWLEKIDGWDLVKFIVADEVELIIARDSSTQDLAVSFRGTACNGEYDENDLSTLQNCVSKIKDTIVDVTVPKVDFLGVPDAVHKGFRDGWMGAREKVLATLRDEISALDPSQLGTLRVYFTGHSMGGGLATLAAWDLEDELVREGLNKNNIVMYSYASPRVITMKAYHQFAEALPNSYAVVRHQDIVPHFLAAGLYGRAEEGSKDYTHIKHTVVLYSDQIPEKDGILDKWGPSKPKATKRRMEIGPGKHYQFCYAYGELVLGPQDVSKYKWAHHGYTQLLSSSVSEQGTPSVDIWTDNDGNMRISANAKGTNGVCDRLGLFKGQSGMKDLDFLEEENLFGNTGRYVLTTSRSKFPSYHVGYVNCFDQIINSKVIEIAKPTLKIWTADTTPRDDRCSCDVLVTPLLKNRVHAKWSTTDPGRRDYIALYGENPANAGPLGYLIGTRTSADKACCEVFETKKGPGYWMAYVVDEKLIGGDSRIIAVAGPTK